MARQKNQLPPTRFWLRGIAAMRNTLVFRRLNSNAITWDTKVRGWVAQVALRFERLLNRNAKLLPKEGKEDVKGYAAPLCIKFPVVRDPC